MARLLLGQTADAQADLRAALVGHVEQGSQVYAVDDVLRIAAAEATDHPQLAAQLLGVFDVNNDLPEPVQRLIRDRYLADLPSRLGGDYHTNYTRGRQLVADLGLPGALAAVAETL